MALAADMYHLIVRQQPGQKVSDGSVDRHGAKASSDDQDNRFVGGQMSILQAGQTVPQKKLGPDRRACKDCFIFRKAGKSLGEIAADFSG